MKDKIFVDTVKMQFDRSFEKPVFKEDKKGGFIKYGKDNLYPDTLLDAYHNKSGKHKDLISPLRPMGEAERAILQGVLDASLQKNQARGPGENIFVRILWVLALFTGMRKDAGVRSDPPPESKH